MSFDTMRDGLHAVVATLKPTYLKEVLKYEPPSIQVSPLAWVLLDSSRRTQAGQVTTMRWRFVTRVASPVTDSQTAEDELMAAALRIPGAVDANPQFSGALVSGLAQSPDIQTGWIILGSTKCRVVDVFTEVVEKFAYLGAIS